MKKSIVVALAFIIVSLHALAEADTTGSRSGPLYETLADMDRQVFEAAFVECDADAFHGLFTEDAEFYHDITGATFGEEVRTLNGCPREDGVRRIPVRGSLAVYPIEGYGAIQTGEHWFVERGAANSTVAKFFHLWRHKDGEWRISRVLSYDHQSVPASVRISAERESDQAPVDAGLLETVMRLDAVVFDDGYNNCDIDKLAAVIGDDLEFYHDQAGPMYGKQPFLDSIENGICKLDYKARRELIEGSLEIFPLHDNGELYGIIQEGEHRFHAKYPGKPEHPTGLARFTLLWLLDDGEWRLMRTWSFDHVGLD